MKPLNGKQVLNIMKSDLYAASEHIDTLEMAGREDKAMLIMLKRDLEKAREDAADYKSDYLHARQDVKIWAVIAGMFALASLYLIFNPAAAIL